MARALIVLLLALRAPVAESMFRGPSLLQAASQARSGSAVSVSLQKRLMVETVAVSKTRAMHKMAYFGTVRLGSQGQAFSVVFDTGSGNLIVPGSDCQSMACKRHDQFQMEHSTTVEEVNCDGAPVPPAMEPDEITITFGTGQITGRCLRDTICVGSLCQVGAFISATEESAMPFASFRFDGVLGLGLTNLAQSPAFSMMGRFADRQALHYPVFSVFLSDSDDENSEITFGDIKREHMGSELFWANVSGTSGYWEVRIDDIVLNKEAQSMCENCKVAVDTGTSELAGPTDLIEKLTKKLDVAPDCSNFGALPQLGFLIAGRVLSLAPDDYVDKVAGWCSLSLMALDVPPPKGPLFIFGIPFLQRYYTVYDESNLRVGFAAAKHAGREPEQLLSLEAHTGHPARGKFLDDAPKPLH